MGQSHSLYYEFMDFALSLAERYNTTPFDIFAQEADEVIWIINHYIAKADENDENNGKSEKIDNFWDFN